MNWIFDNMQLVIVIASAFAWWLNKRREDAALDEQTPPTKRSNEDYAEVERRRKIQEEIRRKIAERRGEVAPASPQDRSRPSPQSTQPVEPEEPDIPPFLRELMGMPERRPVAPPVEPPPMPTTSPGFDRQAEMQAELCKLEEKKKEAEAMSANFRAASSRSGPRKRRPSATSGDSGRDLLATLRDSKSARRAIVLREILDKPVALR